MIGRHRTPFSIKEHILIWATILLMLGIPLALMEYQSHCERTAQHQWNARYHR
jgi:hypothetical protein